MSKRSTLVLVVTLAGLLLCTVRASRNASLAQGEDPVGPQAVVTPLLQYQGRLTDPGTGDLVPDGVYEVSFRLYNVESGGTPLWTETEDVTVQAGLFSTVLGDTTALNLALFNGQALWLGIKVGADAEAAPRQAVLPVAYALSLVPGAMVQANSAPVLQVNHTGGGEALRVGGNLNVSGSLVGGSHTHSGEAITAGTVADARIASSIARDAEVLDAFKVHSDDPDAHHTRYTDTEAWNAILSRDGPGSGLNADLLDGYDSSRFFVLNENETVTGRPAFNGGTSGSSSPFTVDSTYPVMNLNADYLDGYSSSAFALSSHSHSGLLLRATSLNVNCPSSKSVGTTWTKIMDVGSFSKLEAGSTVEMIFNGRLYVGSFGSGATGTSFELRVDNQATTHGRARAIVRNYEAGTGVPVSMAGIFTGLGAGTRTVSIWAFTWYGTASGVMVDPGCFSADHMVVKEFK